jgi:hypothetical protein
MILLPPTVCAAAATGLVVTLAQPIVEAVLSCPKPVRAKKPSDKSKANLHGPRPSLWDAA